MATAPRNKLTLNAMRGTQQILVPRVKTEQGHNALLTREGFMEARMVIEAQIMLEPQLQEQIRLGSWAAAWQVLLDAQLEQDRSSKQVGGVSAEAIRFTGKAATRTCSQSQDGHPPCQPVEQCAVHWSTGIVASRHVEVCGCCSAVCCGP